MPINFPHKILYRYAGFSHTLNKQEKLFCINVLMSNLSRVMNSHVNFALQHFKNKNEGVAKYQF